LPKTILLEFNELCPPLMEQWIAERRLPNFERLRQQSHVFTTEPDVTDAAKLEPWIQWYSLHTGLAFDEHRVFHLTEGAKAANEDIYSTMIAAGRRVGSFASMNVRPFSSPGSFFVGDPWTESGDASPAELNDYNRFVSYSVREYSNAASRLALRDYARFLNFMLRHGLAASTIVAIMRQLATERLQDPRLSYRRVAILDRMQFDVFRHYYRRMKPELASFFINSTAHLQHSYWRHMAPESFKIRPGADEQHVYGDAIRFGYEAMDKLVGEFLTLAEHEGARLIFATALSQQPFLLHEEVGGQHFYRAANIERFLRDLDIVAEDVDPTMTHQYLARFKDKDTRDDARAKLSALTIGGTPLIGFASIETSERELYLGCNVTRKALPDAVFTSALSGRSWNFADAFYKLDAIKSGRHHPSGMLWIQTGQHRPINMPVSILDVFPTLLDLHGVPTPPAVERRGKSLVPLLS